MMEGWGKISEAAKYGGISVRTLRNWLKLGLQHSRLPSGTILIKFNEIDSFLDQFSVKSSGDDTVDRIVDEVMGSY